MSKKNYNPQGELYYDNIPINGIKGNDYSYIDSCGSFNSANTRSKDSSYDNESWITQYGKGMMLFEASNPWYSNISNPKRDGIIEEEAIPKEKDNDEESTDSSIYREDEKKIDFNVIACVLIFLIFFLVSIRFLLNLKN